MATQDPDPVPDAMVVPANALVVLLGPPGSGKSTFARRRFRDTEVVSSDGCRRLVSDDEADQSATPQAFAVFHAILEGRLSLGRLAVADATNVTPRSREGLREVAARYGAPVVVLVMDAPLERCLGQNLLRARRVAPEVIEMHYRQYEEARGALEAEGYHAVHLVGPETAVALGPPVRRPPPALPSPSAPGPAGDPAPSPPDDAATPRRRVGVLRARTRRAPGPRGQP
ncbi:MAG TPA: AAA family ATPase [Longimicrobiaceae bacterium]